MTDPPRLPTPEELEADAEKADLHRKLSRARREAAEHRSVSERLQKELDLSEARLEALTSLQESDHRPLVIPRREPGSAKTLSVANFVWSDWHVEEVITEEETGGLNHYTLDVAERRIQAMTRNCLQLTEGCRADTEIQEAVVYLLGDFWTGWIHEEMMAGSATQLSPVRSLEWLQPRLAGALELLASHGGFSKIRVLCKSGNHGRITKRRWVHGHADMSLETVLFGFLADRFRDHRKIEFHIDKSYYSVVPYFEGAVRVRAHHGDARGLNYRGGVGGLAVPLRRWIKEANRSHPAHYDVIGHYHSRTSSIGEACVNGSLCGYNAFAMELGFAYEPPQQSFFLVSQRWNCVTITAPVFAE